MTKQVNFARITAVTAACLTLSACKTFSMPQIDIMKSPEFAEDAANIEKSFPKVKDAPVAPTDIRADAQWDTDARDLLALREPANPIEAAPYFSEVEAQAEYEALKAKAQAYKLDDPATGPVDIYPDDYVPRR